MVSTLDVKKEKEKALDEKNGKENWASSLCFQMQLVPLRRGVRCGSGDQVSDLAGHRHGGAV
jgi:hypothetical protein